MIVMYSSLYLSLLIAAFLFSIRGRVGLDLGETGKYTKLLCGSTRYALHSATRIVLSPTKDREVLTHVSGGGGTGSGYHAPVTSSTTTITHLQFFLKEAEGKERPIQLQNIDLALRDGQKLSAVWGD